MSDYSISPSLIHIPAAWLQHCFNYAALYMCIQHGISITGEFMTAGWFQHDFSITVESMQPFVN